jgi:lipid-A-disaccharide synthase
MTKIFIIAGEASGDRLGAALIASLRKQAPGLSLRGIGGPLMQEAGLKESFFPMEDLSLMGVAEIVPKIPHLLRRIGQTVMAIKVFDPDVVITIDSPDFSFRVQERLKKAGVRARRIHMVAPTVWAWREGRARKVAGFLDGMICLFPFEPPYFEREGLSAIAVGHPVMASGILDANGKEFRFRHMLGGDQKILGLFPGSRSGEIERHAPVIFDMARQLKERHPDLALVVPTLGNRKPRIEELLRQYQLTALVTTDAQEKWQAFKACDAAIAVSGTVGLELAVADVPHVIAYRLNRLSWEILSRIVKAKFAHLANILLGRSVVPEFIQDDMRADKILPIVEDLLLDSGKAEAQRRDFASVRAKLLPPPPEKNAADSAAAFVLHSITG